MVSLPLKPIKKILQHYHQGGVSVETVIFLRDVIYEIIDSLAQEAVKEFHKRNQARQLLGLPTLRRLDKTSIKIVGERILNQLNNKNIVDEVGKHNEILLCQDGAKSNE